MRSISELVNATDSALPLVKEWISSSTVACELLPPAADSARVLLGLQVTTHSTLGAIAYETGGLLIDKGWLRVLGSGHSRLGRSIIDWNEGRSSGFLLVADDVVGGFFAINSGEFGEDSGAMYYWAPDSLNWEPMNIGYSAFVQWSLSERLSDFYSTLRWPGWESDAASFLGDKCFNFYPPLWMKEGSILGSSSKVVPISEQFDLNVDLEAQLNSPKS